MNPPACMLSRWSRSKWATVIGGLFLIQAALIFAFAQRESPAPARAPSGPQIHMVTSPLSARRIAASFFASDPTLFSSISRHGFSGQAWLEYAQPAYAIPGADIPPRWLSVNPGELGRVAEASMARLGGVRAPEPLGGPLVESTPFQKQTEPIRPRSSVRLTGALVSRQTQLPDNLRAWPLSSEPGAMLVSNTVVELAADSQGEVVSVRLRSKSGLDAADAEALRAAWNLHFSPLPAGAANAPPMTWSHLVFRWQTTPETNSPAAP